MLYCLAAINPVDVLATIGWGVATIVMLRVMQREWRGPRRGDAIHCRRCEYIVFGVASGICPECGITLRPRTMVRGTRTPTPRRRIIAGTILLAVLLGTSTDSARRYAGFQWRTITPFRLLHMLALRDDDKSLTELTRRLAAGTLASHHVEELVDDALARFDTPENQSPGLEWQTVLQIAVRTDGLTPEQLATLFQRLTAFSLDIRRPTVEGDPLVAWARVGKVKSWQWYDSFAFTVRGYELDIGGQRAASHKTVVNFNWYQSSSDASYIMWGELTDLLEVQPPAGNHQIEVRLNVEVFNVGGTMSARCVVPVVSYCEVRREHETNPLGAHSIIRERGPLVTVDPVLVRRNGESCEAQINVHLTQPRLVQTGVILFDANCYLVLEDRELMIGGLRSRYGEPANLSVTVPITCEPSRALQIDIRTNDDAVRRTIDMFDYWQGTIARVVPVVWSTPTE